MGGTFFFSAAAIFRVTKISGNISQYSVKGFNLNVTDYLLKPFELEYFLIAVNKVKTGLTENIIQVKPGIKDYLFLDVQKKKMKILFSKVLFVESQRKYIKIFTTFNFFLFFH